MAFRNRLISASSMTSAWPIQLRLDTRESSEILQKYQGNTLEFAISRHAVRLPAPNNCDPSQIGDTTRKGHLKLSHRACRPAEQNVPPLSENKDCDQLCAW